MNCIFNTYVLSTFHRQTIAKNAYMDWNLANDLSLCHTTGHLPKPNTDSSTHPECSCSNGPELLKRYHLLARISSPSSQGKHMKHSQMQHFPYLIYGSSIPLKMV